jgi:hypothetical protein
VLPLSRAALPTLGIMAVKSRRARVEDVHQLAMSMPHVSVEYGPSGNAIYQVGGKSFVFFRNPRPDAIDPSTGERYPDVIMFWVPSESDKQALIQDQASPFFTTSHFDGAPVSAGAGEPDRRAHPAGADRSGRGSLALSSIGQEGHDLAQCASVVGRGVQIILNTSFGK